MAMGGTESMEAAETLSARVGTNVEEELLAGVAEDKQAAPTQHTAAALATGSSVATAPKIDMHGDERFRK
ncbi:hypothetical protein PAHAL_8G153500 [Panicum hallii]|jgi:hypothetical protein|uniref:Uncharacterized protein n=1 Tax=Panicum hallii TaxID=206008 RepID=A0A2T8I8Y1_9POAL|nr:hypothetical protein PAHAL_8G153500 [Panicum hallii]